MVYSTDRMLITSMQLASLLAFHCIASVIPSILMDI